MPGSLTPSRLMDQPVLCQVIVEGVIAERLHDWFEQMEIRPDGPNTTCLRGKLPDQAALLGLLQRLYSLGYPLRQVTVEQSTI